MSSSQSTVQFTILISLFFIVPFVSISQESRLESDESIISRYIDQISVDTLKSLLTFIASEECEGRETGSDGIKKAATYIEDFYIRSGVEPGGKDGSYFQNVDFTWIYWDDIYLEARGEKYRHLWSFLAFQDKNSDLLDFIKEEVIFLGFGIDDPVYSDYNDVDVKDKIILIYKNEPIDEDSIFLISQNKNPSKWNNNIDLKAETAYKHGAKLVMVIEDEMRRVLAENRRFLIGPKVLLGLPEQNQELTQTNTLLISTTLAKDLIGDQFEEVVRVRNAINKTGQNESVKIPIDIKVHMQKTVTSLSCKNIVAKVEGSEEGFKDEYIILSSHYDHLGKRGDDIFFGADDDGSGTSGVMEIMRVIAKAKAEGNGPKRTIIALHFTGEEKGLLGSKYYVNNPIYPLSETIVNLNIDMIGRIDDIYVDDPNYIYVIGADKISQELNDINEWSNDRFIGLNLDYTYNDEEDPNRFYYRSDHYNFASNGIPIIFYFNGTHEDYHLTSDTVDKIHFDKMKKICSLAASVAFEIGNRKKPLEITN